MTLPIAPCEPTDNFANEDPSPICLRNQIVYCFQHQYPILAPSAGICPHCGRNIFTNVSQSASPVSIGYTQEEARNSYIAKCPHCGAEF